jgi:amino acid transporter
VSESLAAQAPPAAASPLEYQAPVRRLGAITLAGLIYSTVCGGAFGVEPLVGAVGPGWAVLLIVLTPLIYSLPVSLLAAELTALIPDEGGYYVWVRQAFGRFWAVQEAWWTLAFGVLQLASFPVLFVSYLAYALGQLGWADAAAWLAAPAAKWAVAAAVIAAGTAVNLLGALDVGRTALVAIVLLLGSFAALLVSWALGGHSVAASTAVIQADLHSGQHTDLLLGLSVIVFNYSSWEKASSFAGEVENPQRNYPIALAVALVLTVLSYLIPVYAGVGATTDPALWTADSGWPAIAERLGGPTLGLVLAVGGMVSMASLFSATLLWVSRIPAVMALDGWLPARFAPAHDANAVPVASVVLVALISAVLAANPFSDLVVVQNMSYTAALVLEVLALFYFRRHLPDAPRAFRVPGGRVGLMLTGGAPLAFSGAVLYASFRDGSAYGTPLALSGLLALAGVGLFYLRRRAAQVTGQSGCPVA